ncbi:MAG: hypothetical protein KDA93_11165 [Planctomycetaceae bacterium]|nr:hypothetical protein [Planctomycetaceae bacterium]
MRPTLRLFSEDADLFHQPPRAMMTVGELCRLLRDADASDRTWLQDFESDHVHVPLDLYEVLQAYAQMLPAA